MGRRRLTGRGRGFVLVGGALVLAGMGLGYHDLTRFGVLLLALVLLAGLSGGGRRARLTADRQISPAVVPYGAAATVRLTVHNHGPGRTRAVAVQEAVDPALGAPVRTVLPDTDAGEGQIVEYAVRGLTRGRHRVGPVHLQVRDAFGLTSTDGAVEGRQELVVLPSVTSLTTAQAATSGAQGDGPTASLVALHGDQDASIRSYQYGDDLRHVHWPATAHRGELMVRQHDRPARRRAILVLDPVFPTDAAGSEAFEWAVAALGSMAVALQEHGYRLQLVTHERATHYDSAAYLDAGEILIALAEAAMAGPAGGAAVRSAARGLARDGGTVVAVLGEDLGSVSEVARLRTAGTTGLACVVPTRPVADSSGATRTPATLTSRLQAAGWRTAVGGPGTTITATWVALTSRSVSRVGAS